MSETVFGILGACIGSSGLTALIVACLQRYWAKKDKREDKQDAIVNGLMVLMVDRVRYLGKCYIRDGCIALEDKETLKEMHGAYKALGGNGHLATVMDEVEHLPIKG